MSSELYTDVNDDILNELSLIELFIIKLFPFPNLTSITALDTNVLVESSKLLVEFIESFQNIILPFLLIAYTPFIFDDTEIISVFDDKSESILLVIFQLPPTAKPTPLFFNITNPPVVLL